MVLQNQLNFYTSNKDNKRLKINQTLGVVICNKLLTQRNIQYLLELLKTNNPNHTISVFNPAKQGLTSKPISSENSDKASTSEAEVPTIMVMPLETNAREKVLDWFSIANRIKSENQELQQAIINKCDFIVCNIISDLSPAFKTLLKKQLTAEEIANQKNNGPIKFILRVSHTIPNSELKKIVGNSQLKRYLISRLKILETGSKENKLINIHRRLLGNEIQQEILKPVHSSILAQEIKSLSPEQCVMQWNGFELYITEFNKVPNCMLEIGRLRELTFRNAKEGTGLVVDLDSFDPIYKHLFIWDRNQLRIVGGYRFAEGQKIIPSFGKKGFYISTLFKIKTEFTETLLQTVELGRSFIIPEYQKSNFLLLMMWKALYQHLFSNPNNRYIIGPVSISEEYSKISRLLIIDYLTKYNKHPEFSSFFKPRKPFRFVNVKGTENIILRNFEQDIQKFDQLISEIQADAIKLPVLLRQYLKQNAKVLAFNRDPKFQNVLDALLILDYHEINKEFQQILQSSIKE